MSYSHTVGSVDIPQYMGTWYVWAGRTTFFERDAYSPAEHYSWNESQNRIDVDFTFHKGGFEGPIKRIPQKAWVKDKVTHARWKVQPFWPLKFDYLILDLDPKYQWTAVGVPSGSYLWIMGRSPQANAKQIEAVIKRVKELGYPVDDIVRMPQKS